MNPDRKVILGFDSIHDVIRAERIIKAEGIWCDLIPTPRELSADCGMAVECLERDRPALEDLQKRKGLGFRRLLCGSMTH